MGKLYDQMLMVMELKNFSPRTIESYTYHMKAFVRMFGKAPDQMGSSEIRQYLHHLKKEKNTSWSNINVARSALKFFYVKVLGRSLDNYDMPSIKKGRKLPVVLSRTEVKSILDGIDNFKHRVIIMTIYSAGLRLGEARCLKIEDIDSKRMQIRVNQGKGSKDRYTLLSEKLLTALRSYYRIYRPHVWLFPGQKKDSPLCETTIQRVFEYAKKKPIFKSQLAFTLYVILLPPIF